MRHHFFLFSALVAVVKDKEVFLTTVRLTTEDFSFQFSPPLWCSFLSEMGTLCCVLTVLEISVIYYYLLTRLSKNLSVLGDGES